MFENVKTPISKARSSFWAGKSAEISGDTNAAELWYSRAAAFPSTFYGQLAIKKMINNFLFLILTKIYQKRKLKSSMKNP